MSAWNNEATSQYLAAVADDLRSHIGSAGMVEDVSVHGDAEQVAIIASIRVGRRTVTLRGRGQNLIAAYAELRRTTAEPLLVAAFREYIDAR